MLNYVSILQHIGYWNQELRSYLKRKGIIPVTKKVEEIVSSVENDDESMFQNMYRTLNSSNLLELSSTQIIAWYLVMIVRRKDGSFWKPFVEVLPSLDELRTLPIAWSFEKQGSKYIKLLPDGFFKKVKEQSDKFQEDYNKVCKFTESLDERMKIDLESFLWGWLVCNTRCIYLNLPDFLNQDSKENFTMVPYVDFLNHTLEEHCTISVNRRYFSVSTAKSNYNVSEQIYFSYGPHTDDRLLCDYGFMLPLGVNIWNDLDITTFILKLLKPLQLEFLRSINFLGEYTITKDSVSFRTEVALATSQEVESNFVVRGHTGEYTCPRRLQSFIDGYSDGRIYCLKSSKILDVIKKEILTSCQERIQNIESLQEKGGDSVRLGAVKRCYLNAQFICG